MKRESNYKMSTTTDPIQETVESFDKIFGVDFEYRGNGGYDFSNGMVANEPNIISLVFEIADLPGEWQGPVERFNATPTERNKLSRVGNMEGEFIEFVFENGDNTVIQAGYLDQVANLFDLEQPIDLNRIEGNQSDSVFPIRVFGDYGNFVMIAPLMNI